MPKLRYLGDAVLRKVCREIREVTPQIQKIAEELIEIADTHQGAGLAAPQIGYDIRMFIVCVGEAADKEGHPIAIDPIIYINPKITKFYKESCTMAEGCLSIPGLIEDLERPKYVDIEAFDIHGKPFKEIKVQGWKSRCIQHEMNHLDGILFFDNLPEKVRQGLQTDLDLIEQKYYRMAQLGSSNRLSEL